MTSTNTFTTATTGSTPATTITMDQAKFGLPNHDNKPTLTTQSRRTITSAVAAASTSVPVSGGTNTYVIHLKNNHNSVQKIFCYSCNQTKTQMAFSISQLNKMATTKRATRFGGSGKRAAHQPLCKSCTPVEVTALKCSNCSRTRLLEMFSKSQRRRQKDGNLICMECRKLLDTERVVVWSEDDDDDEKEYGDEDKGEGDGDGDDGFKVESLFDRSEVEVMKFDWTDTVEEGDQDWHNGSLDDMFL
ncbi:hypothetical protein BGZ90_004146 [Linnemannia elongata]|nr:hypothetical protein BGZ90_004146 [Linnemannia elongata]